MQKGVVSAVTGAVLAIAVALVVAGCGGGGSDSSTAAISKPQYVKQANAICKEGQQKREAAVNELAEEVKPGAQVGELPKGRLVETVIPPFEETVEELAALPAPEGEEEQVEAIVGSYEKVVEEIGEDEEVAFNGELFKDADAKALKYGLEDCVL